MPILTNLYFWSYLKIKYLRLCSVKINKNESWYLRTKRKYFDLIKHKQKRVNPKIKSTKNDNLTSYQKQFSKGNTRIVETKLFVKYYKWIWIKMSFWKIVLFARSAIFKTKIEDLIFEGYFYKIEKWCDHDVNLVCN